MSQTPVATSPTGRRERKKQETRRALQQAALRLFAERGYAETTVEDITETADVAVRTFFRHFGSKRDVLVGDIIALSARLRTLLRESPTDQPPLRAVWSALRELAAGYEVDRESLLLQARLIEQEPALHTAHVEANLCFDQIIAEFVAARTGTHPTRDPYPRLVAGLAVSTLQVVLSVWARRDGYDRITDLLDEAFDLLSRGLAPPAEGTAAGGATGPA